jgi:hypothetical protein
VRFLIQVIFLVSSIPVFAGDFPYQSQSFIRFPSVSGRPGLIQILVPEAVESFSYRLPGEREWRVEKDAMLLYDKRNSLPEIGHAGGNFMFFKNGHLATISAGGSLFYLGAVGVTPSVTGGVYFVDAATGELCVVDAFGYWMRTGIRPGPIRVVGGNYFITASGGLTTIRSVGIAPGNPAGAVIEKTGWSFAGVRQAGGNFFVRADGGVVTIDSETGFFRDAVFPDAPPAISGGNYFIGEDRLLYTVSFDGKLYRNTGQEIPVPPRRRGYAFLQPGEGRVIAIDSRGVPHRSLLRVSTTGVRIGRVERFEEPPEEGPEPGSLFLPKIVEREN